jgi:hypothetical protein
MKKFVLALSLMVLLSIVGLSMAAPVIIPLAGTEDYTNSITMDIPANVVGSSSSFDTEHVYNVEIKGTSWTIFVFLKSFGAARPNDPINVSADTNIQYFQSKNMHLISDTVAENTNYGLYREQEFGWADGNYITERTFMLDKKHLVFVMSPFDRATTTKMFNSIVLGTSNSMYQV